ncbi:Oxygen-independent coproporphyrinogen-III oxidase [Microbulbifer aggregans]|uniref:Coproporphyrinogen-III oxidase n=1 Tax=Microbulbifer aggregans TaxID=1769779 RepID=A0A1C9W3R2_9GAMM|nr:oxygen-independent coproporphyrinogen III oxidase [Microbulbifer aggregans]AOS95796.1 Oxygen-independent coproporphyrinogen-III oxidase [Microbulbifer aggregans]
MVQADSVPSAALLNRYGSSCPRYTSYPTADRFGALGGAEPWAALKDIRALSLYVHIPFCRSLCYFCACNKVVTQQYGLASSYLEQLLAEARSYRDRVADVPVVQLHLGGGTPTFLNDGDLHRLVEGLGETFNLGGEGREYGIEADPRTLELESLATLRELGFNRLSLGIQDFDLTVQRAINRICTAEQVRELTDEARRQGFESISYDLIYGLPHQNLDTLRGTIDQVMELAPDRIALYHYAHLPERFKAQRLIDTDAVPGAAEKVEMQLAAVQALEEAGYDYLGMDHFARRDDSMARAARDGELQRNFQGYTLMPADALVGLGASAISYSADGYWQNHHRLKDYNAAIAERRSAVFRGWQLSADDRLRQYVIMELMCRLSLDKSEVARRAGAAFDDYFAAERARLEPLKADGLIEEDADRLWITPLGRWFVRHVAAAFDAYLARRQETPRYSKVI